MALNFAFSLVYCKDFLYARPQLKFGRSTGRWTLIPWYVKLINKTGGSAQAFYSNGVIRLLNRFLLKVTRTSHGAAYLKTPQYPVNERLCLIQLNRFLISHGCRRRNEDCQVPALLFQFNFLGE